MGKFDAHFKMSEPDAVEYAKEVLKYFPPDAELTAEEIGDGNINYVFRVRDQNSGRSLIIKHADTIIRSSGRASDPVHSNLEAEMLGIQNRLAPEFVPAIYHYDPVMLCIVEEDLGDYSNMRHELCRHIPFPGFAGQISTFLVKALMGTCGAVMPPEEKRALMAQFTNIQLDEITQRLVYTEPYLNTQGKNKHQGHNEAFFVTQLYRDPALHLEAAKLKEEFESNCQCLLHGDLHTGSIMIKQGSMKVLDPEFATYGPAGYDVGNVMANLIFAWVNAQVTMPEGGEKAAYLQWLEETIVAIPDTFRADSIAYLRQYTRDPLLKVEGFASHFVDSILQDTAGICGLELNRRIVGVAQVKDIAGIEDVLQRCTAERACIYMGKACIMGRQQGFRQGSDYLRAMYMALEKATMADKKGQGADR